MFVGFLFFRSKRLNLAKISKNISLWQHVQIIQLRVAEQVR